MLFIIGDSHALALADGLARLSLTERRAVQALHGPVRIGMIGTSARLRARFFKERRKEIVLRGAVGKRFAKVTGGAPKITNRDSGTFLISAGFHCGITIAERGAGYTMRLDATDCHHISAGTFRQIVLDANRYVLRFLMALKRMPVRVAIIGSPPPPRDIATNLADLLPMIEHGRALFAQELRELGIPYVLPPDSVLDGRFMRSGLNASRRVGDDHGNAEYGEIMLRHVLKSIGNLQASQG